MNLIEQQTAAKELPMQYLQQAVNGQNPNLTPWIATAELQRRTTMNQHMQNAQGPQGPQPTVKDQVEQKAGLMATQAAQQAQAAQAQQSSTPPGPVPAGVPQPEPQPEEPIMAARGGLMNAPVNFKFAHGGILGYAGDEPQGSQVRETFVDSLGIERDAKTGEPVKSTLERMGEWRDRQQAQAAVPRRQVANAADERMLRLEAPSAAADSAAAARADDRTRRPSLQGQGIKAALPQPAPPGSGAAQRPPAPPMQKPQVPPQENQGQTDQGQPAPMSPEGQVASEYAKSAAPAASLADIIAENKQLQQAAGTDQPIGAGQAAQQAQQDELQKQQQEQAKKLAWSAFVQGTVGGPGAGSLAYDQTMANALGQGAEYGQKKYKNIAELEAARRASAEKQQGEMGTALGASKLAQATGAHNRAQVGATLYGDQTRAATAKMQDLTTRYNNEQTNKMHLKVAELNRAMQSNQFNRQEARDAANQLNTMGQRVEADVNNLRAQFAAAQKMSETEEMARIRPLLTRAENLHRNVLETIAQSTGVPMPKDTAPPPTMTPAQAAALAKYGVK